MNHQNKQKSSSRTPWMNKYSSEYSSNKWTNEWERKTMNLRKFIERMNIFTIKNFWNLMNKWIQPLKKS